MKPALLSLIALTVLAAEAPKPEPLLVGRYQLVPASVHISDAHGKLFSKDCIFKVDSATGKTWCFQTLITEEKHRQEYWNLVVHAEQIFLTNTTKP